MLANPNVLFFVVFIAVTGLVGLVAFMFRDTGSAKTAERLESLVGKRRRDSEAELLLRQSHRQSDKQNLLDALTPEFLSMGKIFEQADCNIKPSTLFGIGIVLALVGGSLSFYATQSYVVAPVIGLVMFTIPFLW